MIAFNDYCGLLVSTTTISYCFVPTLFSAVSLSIYSLVIVSLRMSYFAPRALLLIIKLIVSGSPGRVLDPLPSSFSTSAELSREVKCLSLFSRQHRTVGFFKCTRIQYHLTRFSP